MRHAFVGQLRGEAALDVAQHAHQQVRGHLGVGHRAVGAAGGRERMESGQGPEPVVGRLRIEPPRQQHG
ncbi:MAG TPA: hypothetical protein VGP22_02710, partial [Albitalea sp.]|nr:hypothetical protein [Albitalea sp.]